MDPAALADAARALLRAAPADFVRERTARQRTVRKDDRDLAAAIGRLRKPAPAAWIVDLLADDGALDDAVGLGPALRQAQADADPQEIATLRKQRSRLVQALAATGAERAEAAGHPATPAVLELVRATIEAGMADPHAGAAIRSGLLLRPLESVGFEDVDLTDALAVPDAVPDAWSGSDAPPIPITAGRRGARRTVGGGPADTAPDTDTGVADTDTADTDTDTGTDERTPEPEPRDPAAARRAARAAETAARRASRDADAALDDAESALDDVEDRRADLARRREDLERRLRDLDREQTDLDAEAERLRRARDDAEAASDRARDALTAVRRHRHDHR